MIQEPKNKLVRLLGAGLVVLSALFASGCSANSAAQQEEAADEAFLEDLVSGWVERWDFLADPKQEIDLDDPKYAEKSKSQLDQAINIELEKLQPYPSMKFDDGELQTQAVDYIGLVEASLDALQYMNVDEAKYNRLWSEVYDKRTIAILDFIDTYELAIPEEHTTTVTEMRTNAELATTRAATEAALTEMICALDWQPVATDDEYYDYFDYKATTANISDTDFTNVALDIALVDEGGVNIGSQYASVSNWRAGQTASFELLFLESPISTFDVTVNWDAADGSYGKLVDVCGSN